MIDVHYRVDTDRSHTEGEIRAEREPGVLVDATPVPAGATFRPPYGLAGTAAVFSMLLGGSVLVGWGFDLPALQGAWPGTRRIPPNGGLILLLLGGALALKIRSPLSFPARAFADITALLATFIGSLTLVEYAFRLDTGIDRYLFLERVVAANIPSPGALSYPAALAACCLGLGLVLIEVRIKGVWLSQVFAVLAGLIAVMALIGHACGASEFYGQLRSNRRVGMPPLSGLGMFVLAAGSLCARPDRGLMALLWSYTPGGMLARWLLFAPAIGLFLTGMVYLFLTHVIPVDQSVRTWALGFSNLFFVTILIWGAAHALHRVGLERDRAHHELEDRVEQRTAELSRANRALHAEIQERQQVENALREARDRLEGQAIELERRVQERTAKLAETVGDLEAFSYSVAHDMRAPLRGMQGFAHLLLEEHASNLNAEARDYLVRIANSATRMDLLIQDALGYTQVLRSETELKPVDLDAITRELVSTFPGWQAPRAEISIVGTLPTALGHESFLVQCLSNLIGNAVKFVGPGRTPNIRIWGETLEEHVRLYIEDNGIGIAAKDRERVFRMFERLNPAEAYEGTGIGLAVVRKTVERMKGRVDFESEPGRGTKFWIELKKPLAA